MTDVGGAVGAAVVPPRVVLCHAERVGADQDDELIAFADKRAAAIAGISMRTLTYWRATGLLRPTISRRTGPRANVRLYSFHDMVSLLVAATLRRRKVSLQHVRRIVSHLRSRGYGDPLRELRFATIGPKVFFQHPDGSWEDGVKRDQLVLQEVIDLDIIRTMVRAGRQRPATSYGKIERRRKTVGSKPVFADTRIPVEIVKRRLEHGFSAEQVMKAYPDLVPADIEAAREYRVSA